MIRICLFCFLFICQNLFSLTFKEKLLSAEPGAYVVTEQGGRIVFLHLHSKKEGHLVFEEICVPSNRGKTVQDWKEWGKKGAQGHVSWILYEIDVEKGTLSECYSPSLNTWAVAEGAPLFLPSLISLDLSDLSEERRLQKGAAHRPGAAGFCPWGPPQVKNGRRIESPSYDVYEAKWPRDGTLIAGKKIVLYFDKKNPHFPFPYWVQAQDGAIKFKMRAIDSGMGFSSPIAKFPKKHAFS